MSIIPFPKANIRSPLDRLTPHEHGEEDDHHDALEAHERFLFDQGRDRRPAPGLKSQKAALPAPAPSSPVASAAVGIWSDPALIVALAFMLARIFSTVGRHLPRPVASLLIEHVRRGDPAARLVADWLLSRKALSERDEAVLLSITNPRLAGPSQQMGGGHNA